MKKEYEKPEIEIIEYEVEEILGNLCTSIGTVVDSTYQDPSGW